MPIVPVMFEMAVVGRRGDGSLSIALLARLPEPLATENACVALLECSIETARAMCRSVGFTLIDGTSDGSAT